MALIRKLVFLVLGFFMAGHAMAQDGFINRTIRWSYRIVQGDSLNPHKKYFFPVPIIAYKPETRWLLGLSLTQLFRTHNGDSITRPSVLRLNFTYSQNHQFSVRPFMDVFTNRNRINIKGTYQFTDFAEYYWGIGISAPKEAKELYHFKMYKVNQKFAYLVLPHLYAGVQYNLERMFDLRYDAAGTMQYATVAGTHGNTSSGGGITVYSDNRNNIFFPTGGHYIELSNCFYGKGLGSTYNFTNVTLDARKYLGLWKENVLAMQAFFNLNWGTVPFRQMGTLGSDVFMRGYYNGRYRDNNAMALQAELRKTVWGPLSVVAFGGFGTVGPQVPDLARQLKLNYGAGLRIMAIPREKLNVRMDYGVGVDGNAAFYLTTGEAF